MKHFKSSNTSHAFLTLLACLVLACISSGCAEMRDAFNVTSIWEEEDDRSKFELPAKNLLNKGMADYSVGKYFTAIEFFEEILDKYPFSQEAILAELKAADCSYHLERYTEAILLYEEFENRHPTNESIPYVIFQKGMCYYKQIDRIDRNTQGAIKAIELFQQLIKAYPSSPYTGEARSRIAAASEFLANHEFFVVKYYIRTEKFDQARVRLNYLLATYPDATISGEARELMTQLEAGNYPDSGLQSMLPELGLPKWDIFGFGEDVD